MRLYAPLNVDEMTTNPKQRRERFISEQILGRGMRD
jgi:hypothetical protein